MQYMLFGAGRLGKRIFQLIGSDNIVAFIDNNKTGYIYDRPILSLNQARELYSYTTIVICISKNTPEILEGVKKQIKEEFGGEYILYSEIILNLFREARKKCNGIYKNFKKEIDYMLEHNDVEMIPYSFRDKYLSLPLEIKLEEEKQLYSFVWNNKKIFIPKAFGKYVFTYIRNLLIEQDELSPHRYFCNYHDVSCDDIFVDCGAAEAFSSLEVVDRVRKIYIFEGDKIWQNALEETFNQYREKVVIVPMYLGGENVGNMTTLDEYFKDIEGNLFLKVDIEGSERKLLEGAQDVLKRLGTHISLCTYHNKNDAEVFSRKFTEMGYNISFSNGWMYVNCDFVKGVIYASK